MDYSIFKPGDKVRGATWPKWREAETVLMSHEKCLVAEDKKGVLMMYKTTNLVKAPERTIRFQNVYTQFGHNPRVEVMASSYLSLERAIDGRGNGNWIGVFEQVFEDGKLVETIYHPDKP